MLGLISNAREAKIPTVACTTMYADTLDEAHWPNLRTLFDLAISYVESQVDGLTAQIAEELERMSFDD
jgi:hypothetical protein